MRLSKTFGSEYAHETREITRNFRCAHLWFRSADNCGSTIRGWIVPILTVRWFYTLPILLCLAGCEHRSGEAIVLSKEHIATAIDPASPTEETGQFDKEREGEITVDSYVMKPEVRGTGHDPRAVKEEQWLVKVRRVDGSRIVNVPADREVFDRLKEGDRVLVRYR